jgi:hypothetical protein
VSSLPNPLPPSTPSGPIAGHYPVEPEGGAVDENAGLVQIAVVVQGITPLIQNAMSEKQLLDLWFKRKPPKTAARRQPREEAAAKVHRLPDGRPHVPATALYSCLVAAGQFVRLDGKRQITTAKKTVLPAMLTILDRELPITLPDSDGSAPWEVDIQQGRNPNGGEAVCLIRPRFDLWQLSFTVEVDQQLMSIAMARDLIDIAGRRCGLHEFTPAHKGTFGCFKSVQWRVLPAVRPVPVT